jgi:hypothetical protein
VSNEAQKSCTKLKLYFYEDKRKIMYAEAFTVHAANDLIPKRER